MLERPRRPSSRRRRRLRRAASAGRRNSIRSPSTSGRLLHQPLPRVDDDLARAQRLAGDVRRAGRGAAAALGARVAVEQVLPRQVLHVATRRTARRPASRSMGRITPFCPGPLVFEKYTLMQRRDDVQVLRVRQIVEEDEDQQRVRPPDHVVAPRSRPRVTRGAEHRRSGARHDLLARRTRRGSTTRSSAVDEQQRDHERRDHATE